MRILRLLVYEGDEKFIKSSLDNRAVKGAHFVGRNAIYETFIAPYIAPKWLDLDHGIQQEIGQEEEQA